MARNKFPKIETKCMREFHLALVQTWVFILISTPDQVKSEFANQHTKSSKSFLLVSLVHKHLKNGIKVWMKVSMHAKTSPSQEPDLMCKKSLFAQNGKKHILQQVSHGLWLFQKHARGPQPTCLESKQAQN